MWGEPDNNYTLHPQQVTRKCVQAIKLMIGQGIDKIHLFIEITTPDFFSNLLFEANSVP